MLIRLAFGSRVGHVTDMSPHEARAMLADGRATLVHGDPVVESRDPVVLGSRLSVDPSSGPPGDGATGPQPVPTIDRITRKRGRR